VRLRPWSAAAHSNLGGALLEQGKYDEAQAHFREALRLEPGMAAAHYNLGLVLLMQAKWKEARPCFEEATRLKPDFVEAHNNLGSLLREQGKFEEAKASYRRALRLRPDFADAHYNLGVTLQEEGKRDEAAASYRRALELKPDYAEAHSNLGKVLRDQGKLEEAVACHRRALELKPDFADAHTNLGTVLRDLGDLEGAAASYRQALRLKPQWADAHYNLGIALQDQGKRQEAVASYRRALELRPDFVNALSNLGNTLREEGNLDEASACYRQALHLKPDFAEAHSNLGLVLEEQGRLDEALVHYDRTVQLEPGFAEGRWNRALAWLLTGNFAQGWPEYEWRHQCKRLGLPACPEPRWDGSPLAGRTILLHTEQGLGDALQFIRYAPLVQQRGGRVHVACHPSLVSLLASCPGIDEVIGQDSPLPAVDVHAALPSLPGLLGTTLESIPALIPYLAAPAALVDHWQRQLRDIGPFRVGIVWQGSPRHLNDRHRSAPLTAFEPLGRVDGVQLVSLQLGTGTEQLAALGDGFTVLDVGGQLSGDWAETAAVLQNLDLVVSVDTAVAHCAGALSVPVWLALPFAPDWRWLLERQDSPWYPTMRLFRQETPGDWPGVFARMEAALRDRWPQ